MKSYTIHATEGITVSCVELLVHWTFLHDYEFAMIERAV